MRPIRTVRFVAACAALATVAAACGGDNSSGSGPTAAPTTGAATTTATSGAATTATTAPVITASPAAPPATAGFDGTTINVGMLATLSGPVAAPIGIPLANGNRVFFEALNAKGGIAGKYKVNLVEADNKYDPAETVKQYAATKDKVVGYVQVLGTPTLLALLQSLNEDKVTAGPATLDAVWQNEKYLLPIQAPYQIQAINGLSYYVQQAGKDKVVCSLVIDSSYGQAGEQGLEYAAQQLGVKVAVKQTYKQGDTDFTAQINAFKDGKCDMVWLTALPDATGGIIGRAAQANFAPQWIAQSPSWLSAFAAAPIAPYLAAHVWLMGDAGPQWGDTSVPGMAQMLNDVKASKVDPNQKPDGYFAFGYLEAWAFAQVLEQAVQRADLSRDGIQKAVTDLGKLQFQGLSPDAVIGAPGARQAPRANSIQKITPETLATNGATTPLVQSLASDAAKAYTLPTS